MNILLVYPELTERSLGFLTYDLLLQRYFLGIRNHLFFTKARAISPVRQRIRHCGSKTAIRGIVSGVL